MNTKLGYYKVGNHIFRNKLQAILYANPSKADISWHFNNEVFDKYDWTIEPPGTLNSIYRDRAKQIREQFDYVIIMASGGADSTNVLYSFLQNDIHVDEIIAAAPLSGLKNWNIDLNDNSADNTITETFVAQIPLMNKISKKYPNLKITIHDYFEDILKMKTDEWIYEASSHWIHFSGTTRHSLDKFSHIKNLAEAGKRIGVVYGIDKPIICRAESGNLYTTVLDPVVNVVTPHFKDKYPNVESVLFYYSPDMPELMIKQAHEVCRWIHLPENWFAKSVMYDKGKSIDFNSSVDRASSWQRSIVPAIYPAINDHRVWQAKKQGIGFNGGFQLDHWVHKLHGQEKFVQMVESDLALFINKIDKKYINSADKINGFVRFHHYWKIGHESNFIPVFKGEINSYTNLQEKI